MVYFSLHMLHVACIFPNHRICCTLQPRNITKQITGEAADNTDTSACRKALLRGNYRVRHVNF